MRIRSVDVRHELLLKPGRLDSISPRRDEGSWSSASAPSLKKMGDISKNNGAFGKKPKGTT